MCVCLCVCVCVCDVAMPSKGTKILEFNQYHKPEKVSFIIYDALGSSREKTDGCKNNSEFLFATKIVEHVLSDFSMPTISSI